MHSHSKDPVKSNMWVRFLVEGLRLALWQKLKGVVSEAPTHVQGSGAMATPFQVSLTSSIQDIF